MRNTPYPAHTFGSRGHAVVALAEAKGMIQGILKLHDDHVIHSQDVGEFEYLPEGEKKVFADAADIEIVVFDASTVSRGGNSSYIFRRRVGLEKGATLTGPMSWRPASAPAPAVDPRSGQIAFGLVCLVIAFFGGLLSLISSTLSVPFVAVGVGCLVLWLIIDAVDKMRGRAIERLGSAYVLARKT
ncbi:hypothetical protein O9X98_06275 [Agrobacterium salinitolerans]|nr:hypothetical protein [Agrobacterium salinitolerans]